MSASAPETTTDYSTGNGPSRRGSGRSSGASGRTGLAVLGLALVAAVALVVSTFLALYDVTTQGNVLRSVTGYEHHSIAMLLLGLASVPMALGARRGARPAMYALAGIGVVVLIVAFTVDLPAALDEGLLAVTYEGAQAEPGTGFYVETLAGALLLVCGGLALLRGRPADAA